jgi:hypothetical protein
LPQGEWRGKVDCGCDAFRSQLVANWQVRKVHVTVDNSGHKVSGFGVDDLVGFSVELCSDLDDQTIQDEHLYRGAAGQAAVADQ